jgi:hypothetical protein
VFKVFIQRTKSAYPEFDIDTKGIKSFAREHYKNAPEDARWNGRQIRNAFHTAVVSSFDECGLMIDIDYTQAMAEYEARTNVAGLDPNDPISYGKDCKVTVKLGRKHFDAVAQAVQLFDKYMYGEPCYASRE